MICSCFVTESHFTETQNLWSVKILFYQIQFFRALKSDLTYFLQSFGLDK